MLVRVLLITGSLPPMTCGVGEYTLTLAKSLADRADVDVTVLTSAAAGEAAAGAPYRVLPIMRAWSRAEFQLVRDVIRQWKPNVVHIQYPTQGYCGRLSWQLPVRLSLLRVPVVQTWHEYFPGTTGFRHTSVALAIAPGDVIVVRPSYTKHMPRWFRALVAHKRLHYIPNAATIPRVDLSEGERAAVRERYARPGKVVLAFFGFCYENKGLDDLLAILDPARHHLVVIGDVNMEDPYQRALVRRIGEPPLAGSVTMAGFLASPEAARVLAAADAVVLPFRDGGGIWNTSIKAAALQGTFVLTTSTEQEGYDAERNVYFARPGDRTELARALDLHGGRRNPNPSHDLAGPTWPEVAERHLAVYRMRIGRGAEVPLHPPKS